MAEKAVCTIITKNYLAHARTLANSLAEHNPEIVLYVLLADKVDGYFDPALEKFKFIYLEDLIDFSSVEKMCFYYTPFELCCALKGALHEYMFERTTVQKWLFLDVDILVYDSLNTLFDQLDQSAILLTPHRTAPWDNKFVDPFELNILKNGTYNAGFLGIRRAESSRLFISWMKGRLTKFCFNDHSFEQFSFRGLYVDQLWLNLVPLYFEHVSFCLKLGANLGHWNIFDKVIGKDEGGKFTVNQEPLLFIHFSGWDIKNTNKVSRHTSECEEMPNFWLEISENYKARLLNNGYEEFINFPYAFNYFSNGKQISLALRHLYYKRVMQGISLHDPFSNDSYSELKRLARKSFLQRLRNRLRILFYIGPMS